MRGTHRLGRTDEALKSFRRAIEYQQPLLDANPDNKTVRRFLGIHRINLAIALRELGRIGESQQEIHEVVEIWPNDPIQLYNCACYLSLCVPKLKDKSESQREEIAAEAVETLKKAIQAGWSDADKIASDSDFDPIRDRDDFKQIVSEIPRQQNEKETADSN